MSYSEPKSQVIRLFLQFVRAHVPLDQAIVASLGGEGREAAIWQEVGIPGSNGWVIERNRQRSRKLIADLPYRYTSSLGNFARGFRSVTGAGHGVDAFHLDLCGTLELATNVARPIIPLVINSRGRCLAITVADARRNPSVDNFPVIEKWLSALLGFRYGRMRERLGREQGEGRELALMREIGFFYAVIDLFRSRNRYAVPDKVRRFEYVSRTSGSPFAMRTYFFHFVPKSQDVGIQRFAKQLYRLWFRERIHDLNRPPDGPRRAEEERQMGDYGKLKTIAEVSGGEVLGQFNDLLSAASGGGKLAAVMADLRALVEKHSGPEAGRPAQARARAAAAAKRPKSKARSKRSRKSKSGPTSGERLDVQVELLKAKARGQAPYERVRLATDERFSKGSGRALFAKTQGSNRPSFLRRLAAHNAPAINEELAKAYSKIEGKEVTLADLRASANQ
jgi:hypothetical protein